MECDATRRTAILKSVSILLPSVALFVGSAETPTSAQSTLETRRSEVYFEALVVSFLDDGAPPENDVLGRVGYRWIAYGGHFEPGVRLTYSNDFVLDDEHTFLGGVEVLYNFTPARRVTAYAVGSWDLIRGNVEALFRSVFGAGLGLRVAAQHRIGFHLTVTGARYFGASRIEDEDALSAAAGLSIFLGGGTREQRRSSAGLGSDVCFPNTASGARALARPPRR